MKYKHIEAAREARLWIAQIIIPAVGVVALMPEVRHAVVEKANKIKARINRKRNKF